MACSPDGRRIVSGSWDGMLKVWDVATGREILTFKAHPVAIHSVAVSPDGRQVVSGSRDKTLKVWDAATGQQTLTLIGHTSWVWCVAFSPDGRRIVSGSADKTLRLWDARGAAGGTHLSARSFGIARNPNNALSSRAGDVSSRTLISLLRNSGWAGGRMAAVSGDSRVPIWKRQCLFDRLDNLANGNRPGQHGGNAWLHRLPQ